MRHDRIFAVVLVAVVGVMTATVAFGSDPYTGTTAGAKYVCTSCKVGADSPGKCPVCAKEMIKAGTYMCPACDTTSDKPGKCGCGRDYVKTELAGKKCGGCGYYIAKDAKSCPVCDARAKKM